MLFTVAGANENKTLFLLPTIGLPLFVEKAAALIQMAPKSCTPAKNTVPSTTHTKAGTHPQITAMAGPMMGAAPATEVK